YVDPVDGTKEFIAKNGEFSVMLGLAIDGVATVGVVYQPETDKLYAGVVGGGAYLEERGERSELKVSDVADPSQLKLVVSRSHRNRAVAEVVARLGITQETTSGSVGLKAGLIAEQKADLYVHISDRSSRWDACGPEAILKAAGGRLTLHRSGGQSVSVRGNRHAQPKRHPRMQRRSLRQRPTGCARGRPRHRTDRVGTRHGAGGLARSLESGNHPMGRGRFTACPSRFARP
ncbi:MAG: hypothetical protein EP303_03665, partial [Deltaproteobacteria bacterium]